MPIPLSPSLTSSIRSVQVAGLGFQQANEAQRFCEEYLTNCLMVEAADVSRRLSEGLSHSEASRWAAVDKAARAWREKAGVGAEVGVFEPVPGQVLD